MNGLRSLKRACAVLGSIALLINLSAAHLLRASSFSADSSLDSLIICTASGAKSIPADHESGGHHAGGHCPACVVAQLVFVAPAVAAALTSPLAVRTARPPAGVSQLPVHVALGAVQIRAPPPPV